MAAGLERMKVTLNGDQTDAMVRYLLLLQRWSRASRAYNLTAVRAPLEMVPRHLLDSLSVLPYLGGDKLLDLGTGPGLPGVSRLRLPHRSGSFICSTATARRSDFCARR